MLLVTYDFLFRHFDLTLWNLKCTWCGPHTNIEGSPKDANIDAFSNEKHTLHLQNRYIYSAAQVPLDNKAGISKCAEMDTSESTSALPSSANEELSPLEQDVLDEYERLAENMKKVRQSLCANASRLSIFHTDIASYSFICDQMLTRV